MISLYDCSTVLLLWLTYLSTHPLADLLLNQERQRIDIWKLRRRLQAPDHVGRRTHAWSALMTARDFGDRKHRKKTIITRISLFCRSVWRAVEF